MWAAVSQRVTQLNGEKNLVRDWRRTPSTHEEVMELFAMLTDIYNYQCKDGADRWEWRGDKDGVYTVKKAKRLIAKQSSIPSAATINWKGWIPLKCKVMVWRAARNRLPTKLELQKRGVAIVDLNYPFCNNAAETALYLFTACIIASEVWMRIGTWCRLSPIYAFEVIDLLRLPEALSNTEEEKDLIRSIVYTSMWCIWNERNANFHGEES